MSRAISAMMAAIESRLRVGIAIAALVALPIGALAQSTGARFDHLTTGFPLTGAHESAKCETCHVKGVFKGTPKACEACHRPGNNLSSAVMPSTHAPTTQRCELCHTTVSFVGARWNHVDAQPGGCVACHNGSTAPGKPAGHVATTQSCDVCHRTSAWIPAGFDHTGIASGCSTCHNGVAAKGKPATHIPTNQPCEACHTSTTSYGVWTMSHAQIVSGCATCHGGQFADVMAKSATHVPTSAPCESCHSSTSTFKGATFDHAGITAGCSSCHNGSTALGLIAGHVPTSQSCELCHSATKFSTFAGATMNHAGIASGCSACHAAGSSYYGVVTKTPPANHIPTGSTACESCHSASNFTSFAGTPMNHAPVSAIACATCHEAGKSWFGVTIVTRPTPAQDPNHPATGDCGTCHTSTSSFATAVGKPANHLPTSQPCALCHSNPSDYSIGTMNHTGITSGCATCHAPGSSFANVTPVSSPATHFPTPQPCETCHAPTNFTTFSGTLMNHAGITGNCANCHATGKSFFGVTMKTPPANHIPTSGAACEGCHSASSFTSFAGTPMNHAPVSAIACATCHEAGKSWFGVTIVTRPTPTQDPNHPTTGDCGACHTSTSSFATAVGKPANHLPTTQPCTLCHSNPGNYAIGTMNHAGIANGCATCHAPGSSFANIVPVTPPATHFPTPQPCETCHAAANFTSFAGTSMNHAGITSGCAICHATGASFFGVTMKTPPANHIPTSGAACEGCHSASSFTSFAGTPMNHNPILVIPCATCHETGKSWFGVTIVTRPTPTQDPNHPTTGDCGACHTSTSSFATAVGKPANHLPTTQPCTLCHSNPGNYAIGTMNHAGIANGCATCHAPGSSFANIVPVTPPATHFPTPQPCETCHAAANFTSFAGTVMNHAGITGNCANCHATGKSFFGVSMKTPPANHIPTGAACETCHSASNFTSFAGTSMSHAGITNGCASCHATGSSFFGVSMKTPPATHIPTGGAACEGCHSASSFTSFAGTPMNHAPVSAIACATCHETGKSWFGVTIVTRPMPAQDPNHPASGDCGGCHTSTSSFATAVGKPANHLPTSQPCALCHSNPSDYSVATMNHTGITSGCAACHAIGSSFANIVPKTPPANHIPTGKACETCHASTNFTTFAGAQMNHAGITNGCVTCHASGASFFGVTMKTPPANHIPTGGAACEGCHSASSFSSFAGTPMNHAPVSAIACATCHETGKSWFGVIIVTRPTPAQDPNHPATGDCGACHTSTSSFATAVGKPANHLPTSQPCALCHSNPSDYSIGTMNHTGITSGCAACHATGSSFANVVPKTPPANHIPTAKPCETCHAATNFSSFSGTLMNHAGITGNCANCHATGKSFFGVTMKTPPATHIPFGGAACEACHAPSNYTSFAGTAMNHTPVAGMKCMSCHELGMSWYGVHIVTRPSPSHNPGQDCAGCHNTRSFDDGGGGGDAAVRLRTQRMQVGPAGATATAAAGARSPVGPEATPSSAVQPRGAGSRNVHVGIAPGSCLTCHNGAAAQGKPAQHVVTALSCDACHRTTTWRPATFTHLGAAPGTCATCHNAMQAKGKSAAHFVTVRSCDTCHRTTSWAAPQYRHVSPAYRPHGAAVSCTACHKTNSEAVVWRTPAFKLDCAGCHAEQFQPQQHPKPGGGLYTVVELRDCSGACHLGGQARTPRTLAARHRPTAAGF